MEYSCDVKCSVGCRIPNQYSLQDFLVASWRTFHALKSVICQSIYNEMKIKIPFSDFFATLLTELRQGWTHAQWSVSLQKDDKTVTIDLRLKLQEKRNPFHAGFAHKSTRFWFEKLMNIWRKDISCWLCVQNLEIP